MLGVASLTHVIPVSHPVIPAPPPSSCPDLFRVSNHEPATHASLDYQDKPGNDERKEAATIESRSGRILGPPVKPEDDNRESGNDELKGKEAFMAIHKNSTLSRYCDHMRCRRAKACRRMRQEPCAGNIALRKTMPARMMRLIMALSLRAGGAKRPLKSNNSEIL